MRRSGRGTIIAVAAALAVGTLVAIAPAGAQTDDATITGRVLDAANAGLGGAQVHAYTVDDVWVGTATTTTAGDGTYELVVPPGSYRILFRAPSDTGWVNEWYDHSPTRADAPHVDVEANDTVTGIDAKLSPGGWIEGTVTGPGGHGVEDALVWVYSTTDRWVGTAAVATNADGTYALGGIPEGAYRVYVWAPNGAGLANRWDGPDGTRAGAPQRDVTWNSVTSGVDIELSGPPSALGCDPLDAKRCHLPFPSDHFTEPAATPTGRQVALRLDDMPTNAGGTPVDPTDWNHNDGFSPGNVSITYVPGLDLAATGAAPITDMAQSLDADAPIVILDAETGERHPYWAEMDANVPEADRPLLVHPARNYEEGKRYIVALRNLRDSNDSPIEPGAIFRKYRDDIASIDPAVEARRDHMESLFSTLGAAGVERDDLYLAWDFTVSSTENLAGSMLHMRDDAFAALGDDAPTFEVTNVVENPSSGIARRIEGTVQVPLYMTNGGAPGGRLTRGEDGLPERVVGDFAAPFTCAIPHSVLGADGSIDPGRISLYGHGLLGLGAQVMNSYVRNTSNELGIVFCGTDWIGMSTNDVGNALTILQDLSSFGSLPDRGQQGLLNFLFLGRAMLHDDGLITDPAFRGPEGEELLDRTELYYDGNSQGAIMGGALAAIGQDFTKVVLGVGGMNYSVLLNRSVDFDAYFAFLRTAYPDALDRSLGYGFIQMLWDRAETNGYAHHITDDPYPNTPAKTVIMQVGFGDHQVANVTADTMARTIGACASFPALPDGRSPDVTPLWGIPAFAALPTMDCSSIVYFDSGSPAPPTENVPPRDGSDPHQDPRWDPQAIAQKDAFFRPDGWIIDPCNGAPCLAEPR